MPKILHFPNIVTIRLTDEQLEAVRVKAEEEDVSMTDVIRTLVDREFFTPSA